MKKAAVCMAVGVLTGIILFWSVAAWGSDYVTGKIIYEGKCQMCHGSNGNGNGPAAASLNPKPADFNDPKFWRTYDEKKMNDVIRSGRGMMPAFDMKPDEIQAIIDYMTRTFKK